MAHEEDPTKRLIAPEQYDEDKNKRLLPQNLVEEQPYIFRSRTQLGAVLLIHDLGITVKKIVRIQNYDFVGVVQDGPENTELNLYLNSEGLAFTREAWPVNVADMTYNEERGYFMGYPTLSETDLDKIFESQGKIRNVGQLALMPPKLH